MVSPDGRLVARLATSRDRVVVLDAATMETAFEVPLPRTRIVGERTVVHAWGGARLAIFDQDLLVIDTGAAVASPVRRFDSPTLLAMSFRADGHLVALDAAGRVLLFDRDFSAFSRRGRLDPQAMPFRHPSFAKDCAVVFSCQRSPELRSTAYDDVPMEPFVTCELVSPAPPHHAALAESCSLVASTDQTVARVWRVDRTRGTILPSRTFYPLPDGEWLSLGDDGTWVASARAGDLVQVTSPAFPGFRSLGDAVAAQGRRARLVWR